MTTTDELLTWILGFTVGIWVFMVFIYLAVLRLGRRK